MKPEIKKLWIDALESGNYIQGMGLLNSSDNKFCCLGVLCDLYAKENNISQNEAWIGNGREYSFLNIDTTQLPEIVMEWSGVTTKNGDYSQTHALSADNDDGMSFKEIVKVIKRYF